MVSENIFWDKGEIGRKDRIKGLSFDNKVIWLTGLSGSGKSTLARYLEAQFHKEGIPCYVLDGDNVRHGLCSDLGFSKEDISENNRRVSEMAKLFHDAGLFTIVSFIGPYARDRNFARNLLKEDFIEVYVECPFEVCQERDTKGLYKRASEGELPGFEIVARSYEVPDNPDFVVNTASESVESCSASIFDYIKGRSLSK